MAQLELTNVITVSVSAAPVGVGRYNTSNLGLFTREVPGASFGTDGYKIYKSASEVITDFGTSSITGQMATAAFSQKPNILSGGGYLAVLPMLASGGTQSAVVAIQRVKFSAVPVSGAFALSYLSNPTASIAYNASAGTIQTSLQAVAGLATATSTGTALLGPIVVTFTGVSGPAALLVASANTLLDVSGNAVAISIETVKIGVAASSETLGAAITRTSGLIQYFGIISAGVELQAELLAAGAIVQALNKVMVIAEKDSAMVNSGGTLDLLRTGSLDQSRGLLYVGSGLDSDAVLFAASYAGRAFSTNFTGSNTTQTMHLKDLATEQPDSSMTQTLLEKCKIAGADVYVSLQGVPKTFSTGGNKFFDRVYNRQAFVGDLQVALFNTLAQTSTKVPQTEQGMSALEAAARQVCLQYVANGYIAPGSWNSPDTFGDPENFVSNISQRGFYVYHQPITQQSQADREARIAPLIQIAIKEAGAIHSASVLIFINA